MLKNTVTGSMLAKLFPTFAKTFLENATQEEVNKAEQEAAVIHQQMQTGIPEASTLPPVAAATETAQKPTATTGTVEIPGPTAADLTAMTTRATTAEEKVTDLTTKLTAAEIDRDRYKAWYDKQANLGTTKPGADASTRGIQEEQNTLSAASQDALNLFQKRQQKA